LTEVDKLLAEAAEAEAKAKAAHDEWDRLTNELNSLPVHIANAQEQLGRLATERTMLESAEQEFINAYRRQLTDSYVGPQSTLYWSSILVTKELRHKLISELEGEQNAAIKRAQTRQVELRRALGMK
jgi:hypothetical protein